MVVGLAEAVAELEVDVADSLGQVVVVGDVGAQCADREERDVASRRRGDRGAAELAHVDHPVVSGGVLVPVESALDVLVAEHARPRSPACISIGGERARPADVVGVAVCVHQRVDGRRRPARAAPRPPLRPVCAPLESKATSPSPVSTTTTWLNDSISATPSASSLSSWVTRFGGASTTPESMIRVDSSIGCTLIATILAPRPPMTSEQCSIAGTRVCYWAVQGGASGSPRQYARRRSTSGRADGSVRAALTRISVAATSRSSANASAAASPRSDAPYPVGERLVVAGRAAPAFVPGHHRGVVPAGRGQAEQIPVDEHRAVVRHHHVAGVDIAVAHHDVGELAPAFVPLDGLDQPGPSPVVDVCRPPRPSVRRSPTRRRPPVS